MSIGWIDAPADVGVYQTRSYGEAAAGSAGAEWDVIGDESGRWRFPVCLSGLSGGLVDAVSPYGYAGIHCADGTSGREIAQLWKRTRGLLADRGVVAAFLRFAPYREKVERWHHDLEELRTVQLSTTIAVPMASEATMWEGMLGRARTEVRKALRAGLTASIDPADFSLTSRLAPFRRVYDATMDRLDAGIQHRHVDEYYARLVRGLPGDVWIVSIRDERGEVVAASILLVDVHGAHYHLSGSIPEYARLGANSLMLWTAMKWAATQNHPILHLGGGTRLNDGLFRFKASFGGISLPFFVGHLIVRPADYDRLVSVRSREIAAAGGDLATTFFPLYRAALP